MNIRIIKQTNIFLGAYSMQASEILIELHNIEGINNSPFWSRLQSC